MGAAIDASDTIRRFDAVVVVIVVAVVVSPGPEEATVVEAVTSVFALVSATLGSRFEDEDGGMAGCVLAVLLGPERGSSNGLAWDRQSRGTVRRLRVF